MPVESAIYEKRTFEHNKLYFQPTDHLFAVEKQSPLTKKLGTTENYGGTFNTPAVIWTTPTRGP
jgi:hypothetical protein